MEKFIVTERWILNLSEVQAVEQGDGAGSETRVWLRGLAAPLTVGNEEHCAILKAIAEGLESKLQEKTASMG